MDITLELADLRSEAESMMTDTATIRRYTDPDPGNIEGSLDPDTGTYPAATPTVVYSGKASLRVPGTVSTGKIRPSAGDTATLLLAILAIPYNAPSVAVQDRVTFTASRFNPVLVGLTYTVTSLLPASIVTKQRATVELVAD